MLKTTNTEFQSIQLWFTDQNNRRQGKYYTNYQIDIIKIKYSTEPKHRKYIRGYGFLSFARRFDDKYGKQLMDTTTKTGIDAAKTASERVVQKLQKLQVF